MNLENFYNKINETFNKKTVSRRGALDGLSKLGLGALTAAIPLAIANNINTGKAFAKGNGLSTSGAPTIIEILNFALTLEYLEAKFYQQGLLAAGLIPGGDRTVFTQINLHEAAHVIDLIGAVQALGGTPTPQPTFDFTAGGLFPDVFTNYTTFLTLAQAFEDTGVRAYKGQAGGLISNDAILTVALQIHSVEARHACEVRRIRGQKGWISLANAGGAPASIYVRENNTVQGGVDVRTITTVGETPITEAFDETLTMAEVLAIAGPFIV
ncbi:MAG: ferritin-like domain-containing protein [Bacteroidota bacterium]|nr:ferritin-like domain-containing protein [Bacteroidota bacterium]